MAASDQKGDDKYKIIVVGAGAVGKSSLTIRYVVGDFFEHYDPTIEDYYRKLVEVDKKSAYLDILDTAGQSEFISMQEAFYRQGKGFLIVYSIDSLNSFMYAKELKEKIKDARYDDDKFAVVLCGNKCDLEHKRQVSKQQGTALAKEWNCCFHETSAKDQINNGKVFEELVREIRKVHGYDKDQNSNKKTDTGTKKKGFCTIL
eukprot:CAMPEP_0202687444 /NCGR_PEP_ID=MMETSP1385-20130828/3125_1 /ASSEMBLY_ACC=CAM_ASM_000861 /TAXON_ID=933848 /ORGANISM="Elphidium margaritaceum" /LENGTH=202 /DNA_ID=CAMNT_0049342235 /DNA_START=29 /DNA_END=637 /DNA_ORIENTATION=-